MDLFELTLEGTAIEYEAALSGVMALEFTGDIRQFSIQSLRQT